MVWLVVIASFLAAAAGIFFVCGGGNYVCIRRKDCCGSGCGCLFPKKKP